MRKLLLLAAMLCASSAHATTFYWAQTAGSLTCDGGTHTAVNTASINSQTLAAGDVVVLCGTVTVAANGFAFGFGQSGTSGNVITLRGASGGGTLTSPAWNANGAINLGGKSFLRVTALTITATANGSGLANQLNSMGIQASGASDYEIDHVTMTHLYDHTSTTDSTPDVTVTGCIYANGVGNNILIHDDTFSDGPWCINLQFSAPSTNLQIYNNSISRMPHGIVLGGTSSAPGGALSNVSIHDNHIFDFGNWSTVTVGCGANSACYHLTGFHFYGVPSHTAISGLQVYNNLFDGAWGNAVCSTLTSGNTGSCLTAFVFEEAGGSEAGITGQNFYNNTGISDAPINNGLFGIYSGTGNKILNNTMIGSTTSDGLCFGSNTTLTGLVFKNNVMTTCNQLALVVLGSGSVFANNIYANGGSNAFVCNSNFYNFSQFANWQACVGGDASPSAAPMSAGLAAGGDPNMGSAVIGVAANLTSLGITPLNSDRHGVARPGGTTAWDAGAANRTAVAGPWTLTIQTTNPSTGVAITGTSDVNGKTAGNSPTSFVYNDGTNVTIGAAATVGSWTGGCTPSGNNCSNAAVHASATYTANYSVTPPVVLTVHSSNPASGVTIVCTADTDVTPFMHNYTVGSTVVCTAPSTVGLNTFQSWTNCPSVAGAVCTFSAIATDTTITANYGGGVGPGCQQASASFSGFSIASQSGTFTTTFSGQPSQNAMDGVTGFSMGAASSYANLAVIMRFSAAGVVDAYNQAAMAYQAANSFPYLGGVIYNFRLVINAAAGTYDGYVTAPGGAETQIASGYTFRTGAEPLDTWNLVSEVGYHVVCAVGIQNPVTHTLKSPVIIVGSGQ